MDQVSEERRRSSVLRRPPSEQLVDLHVYFVPEERWLRKRKLARNHVVDYAISAGFIRIVPTSRLVEVRQEIGVQLGNEVVPDNYVFLKSVGRNFTQVKASQEMELKAKNFMPPYANEPEIYLKAGRFSDHSWSQGDDGIPEKNFLEAHRTHEVIERKIVGLSSPLSSPEPFLPHVDATRFVLTRPSKVRRSSVSSGTGRRHQLNGEPVQGHQVSSTTTTTTRKSTTTIEEHSTSNTVHLLRLSSASLSGSASACPAEDVPNQGVIRTHADRTSSEAEADEVADAPPPTTARRRSSVAVPEGSVGSDYHRRLSRASGAGDTAGTEAEAEVDDKLGRSSAPRGAQRRLSLAEARRKSIAERGDLLAVPTPQQLRKLSFAESVRDGRDTPDIRLKEQPESGGPQDIEGESAQAKRRSRDASALSRTTNRDAGSEAKPEVEPDATEPEVEPLVEPEVDRETQESANQDEQLEDSNEVEAGAENQESALLSGVTDSGDAEVEPGLEPGDKLASEPENKVADESGVASVGNEVANAATGYDRKSKKKGDKGTRRSKYQGGTRVSGAKAGQGNTTSLAGMSRKATGRDGKDVVIEKAKVRLLPGRPSGQDSAAVRAEVEEIKEYVRGDRGYKRHLDSSRRSVGVVDTAKRVTESYRKSDTAKRMSKNEKLEVEVFVTELGESGTQTLEPGSDGALLKGDGTSKGDGGGASQMSRGQRPLGKTKGGVGLIEREGASIPSVQRLVAATGSIVADGLAETAPGTESGNVEGDCANNHIDREGAGEGNNEVAAADEGQDVKQSSLETTTGESAAGNLSADDERSEDEALRSHSASQALGDLAEPVKDNENNSGEANLFKEGEIKPSLAELQGSSGSLEGAGRTLEKIESRSEGDIMLNGDESNPAAVGIGETGPDAENNEEPGDEPTGLVEEQPAMVDAENGHEATHKNISTILDDVDDQSAVQKSDTENSHENKTDQEQGGSAEEQVQVADAELKQDEDKTTPYLEDSDGQEKNRVETPADNDITHENVEKAEGSQFTNDGIVVTDTNVKDNEDEGKEELETGIPSDGTLDPHDGESSSKDRNDLESLVNAEEPATLGNNADETQSLGDSIAPTQNLTETLDPTNGSPTHADVRNFPHAITDEKISKPEAVISEDLHSEISPKEDSYKDVFRDDDISVGIDDGEINAATANSIGLISGDGDQEVENLRTGDYHNEDTNMVTSEGEAAQNKTAKDLAGTDVDIGDEPVEKDADTTGAEDSLVTEENKLAKSFSQDQEPSYLANMIASRENSTDNGADEAPESVNVAKEGGSQPSADGGNITILGESQVTTDDISANNLEEPVAEELVMPQDSNMLYKVNESTSKIPDQVAVDDGENTESGENSVPNKSENNVNEDVLIYDEPKPQTAGESAENLSDSEQRDDHEAISPLSESSATNNRPGNSDEVVAQSEHTDGDILLKDNDSSNGNPTSEPASNLENTEAQREGDEATVVIGEGISGIDNGEDNHGSTTRPASAKSAAEDDIDRNDVSISTKESDPDGVNSLSDKDPRPLPAKPDTNGTTDLEAHKAEDGLHDHEQGITESQKSHQEEFANTNLTGSPSGHEPSATEDASRTEEDSAYVDGTSTTTPSPAVSRADVISPKDIHESETADEGISVDEMPPTRDSNRDEEEASTDAASSSGRGSRGTVSEVPLVIHKPQIRTPKNDATAKYKVRPPKGLTLFPQRFKTSPKGAQRTGQSQVSGVTGMRRVRSDGETLDKTGGSRTVLTTPGSSEKGSSLLGRNSRSVNMEEQGLVEIARLQKKLDGLREERLFCEAKREDLLRRAKFLQNKTTSTRDQARDMWRRRYAEERKTTPKLEEECSRWRMELERLHRELLAKVEGELRVTGYPRLEQPSNKLSYKIVIAKIIQEIEDLKRRLDYTRISLGAEVRLRTHAEREVKNLREDLLKKKIQVTLTKKETQSVMAPFLRDSFYFVGPI